MTDRLRVERAANEVAETVRSLALDVSEDVLEDIRRLADKIGKEFRKVAYNTKDVFDDLADDLEEMADVPPTESSEDSSEDEQPPPKQQRADDQARFAAHKAATGYSHPEQCTIRASEDSDDSEAYMTPYYGGCDCGEKH